MKYSAEEYQHLKDLADSTAISLINVALACQAMTQGKKSPDSIENQYKKLRESHENYQAAQLAIELAQQFKIDSS